MILSPAKVCCGSLCVAVVFRSCTIKFFAQLIILRNPYAFWLAHEKDEEEVRREC